MSEVPTRIEPCLVGDTIPSAIANLIVDITSQVAVLDQIAHPEPPAGPDAGGGRP